MALLTESDRCIYREELAPRLPKRIFDAHVHVFGKDSFPADFAFEKQSVYTRFGGEFPLEAWRAAMAEVLPEQEVWLNCFGTPNNAANRDLVPPVNRKNEFGDVLISPADPVELVQKRVEATHAIGVKPYLNYGAQYYGKPSSQVEVADMLTKDQLAYLDREGLAVTFHIPRSGRFADKLNQRQMIDICENYPNIRMIWAHIGRAYFMKNIRESNISEFAKYPNCYFDTAMVNGTDILKYTYDHFPAERIVFGTDSPIALLHGKSVEINNQYAYLMAENCKIGTAIIDADHAVNFTLFFYEQLRAILDATPADKLNAVFFDTAKSIFTEIASRRA